MKCFYTLLFCLSIISIDPWGLSRGEIWTQPKVLAVLLIGLLNCSILWEDRAVLTIPRSWKISLILWGLFLSVGLFSTLLSPFPISSFLGQDQMGDGWLYWLLIAAFTLSNSLLLRHHPELLLPQLRGILIGGAILAISIFPQIIDWRVDYTATMGQLLRKHVLVSTIFKGHQPIGLYSHRGHSAFVLVIVAVVSLVSWQKRWLPAWVTTAVLVVVSPALLFAQTRAALLALTLAIFYLLGGKYYKQLIPIGLICLIGIGLISTDRQIAGLSPLKQVTSDRIYLWHISQRGIRQRPLFGWGFDGFGIAYPYIFKSQWQPQVLRLGIFSFDYQDETGKIRTLKLPTYKAHNLIFDTILSIGIVGMLSYSLLLGFYLWQNLSGRDRELASVAIAYLAFTFIWFDCAQFTHLLWWAILLRTDTSDRPIKPSRRA